MAVNTGGGTLYFCTDTAFVAPAFLNGGVVVHTPVLKQVIRHVFAVAQKLGFVDKPREAVVAVPAARRRARTEAVAVRGPVSSAREMALIGCSCCWVRVLQRRAGARSNSRFSCCHGEQAPAGCDRKDAQRKYCQHTGGACTVFEPPKAPGVCFAVHWFRAVARGLSVVAF